MSEPSPVAPHGLLSSPPLRRNHLVWITLAYFLLVIYGSLVPLQLRPMSLEQAFERFEQIPYLQLGIHSRSDWVANILLFIPLSFLVMAALCVDRGRRVGIAAAAVVVPACILLAVGIEFVQVFFPPRTVSINDVVAESLGGLIGTSLWLARGQSITNWCRRVWTANRVHGAAGLLLPGYLVFLVLIHVMPLDLTISPVEVYHKWNEGRVHLVPFSASYDSVFWAVQKTLWNMAYFLPVGALWRLIPTRCGSLRQRVGGVLALGLGVASVVEMLQLFVYTRYFDTTDILTGALGVLLGWTAVGFLRQSSGISTEDERQANARRYDRASSPTRPVFLGLAILVWLGVLVTSHWYPFGFIFDRELIADGLDRIGGLPFVDYYYQTEYHSFDQFLQKTLLFLPLGVLFTLSLPPGWGRWAGPLVLLSVFGVAATLEAGQLFLPSRYPGLTDVLIETFGGCMGYAFIKWARSVQPPADQPRAVQYGQSRVRVQDSR